MLASHPRRDVRGCTVPAHRRPCGRPGTPGEAFQHQALPQPPSKRKSSPRSPQVCEGVPPGCSERVPGHLRGRPGGLASTPQARCDLGRKGLLSCGVSLHSRTLPTHV